MSRYARRIDNNARAIVNALRALGASVEPHSGSTGAPDLVVGYRGVTTWAEVKPVTGTKARGELRETQVDWHQGWRGRKPVVLRTFEDVRALLVELGRAEVNCLEVTRD